MSPTLFWYVFRDLVKIFLMASGVIAGIMSFGGLLRPLMEYGLGLGQVTQMLACFMPAMTTYAYPVAALFATTVVYGRLASDNEVTAVRAAGISLGPLGLGLPALVSGAILCVISFLLLSYVVPVFTLKAEQTIFTNIGQLVASRIEQTHQIKLQQIGSQPITIFARSARVEPNDPNLPNEQFVTLNGVSIVTYETDGSDQKLQIPAEFFMAEEATASIKQVQGDQATEEPVLLSAILKNGMKFPRDVTGQKDAPIQGGVSVQNFGPIPLPSIIRENTKFMDIRRLQYLSQHPEKSRRIGEILSTFIRMDQQYDYLGILRREFDDTGILKFVTADGTQYKLNAASAISDIDIPHLRFVISSKDGVTPINLVQTRLNAPPLEAQAKSIRIRVFPNNSDNAISVALEMFDAKVIVQGNEAFPGNFERAFTVAMPAHVSAIRNNTADHYDSATRLLPDQRDLVPNLRRNLMRQNNSVISEFYSRLSFAISCLVLVLVGYGLGVMFKSGNYLTAFAVSVVPALLSIVLIVTGQHICENVPYDLGKDFKNPLGLGLAVLWSGNAIVLLLAVGLMWRLRRT